MHTLKFTVDHPPLWTPVTAGKIIREAPPTDKKTQIWEITEQYLLLKNKNSENVKVTVLDTFHYLMDTAIDEAGNNTGTREERVYLTWYTLELETPKEVMQLSCTTKWYILSVLSYVK